MSLWKKRDGSSRIGRPLEIAHAIEQAAATAGRYQSLYKYLRDRYADRVVLTFGEIEDLLGFGLPASARFQGEWWDAGPDPIGPGSPQAASWLLARRTARVNLAAQSVVFDRQTPLDSRSGGR